MKEWLHRINRVGVLPRPTGTDLRYSEWSRSLPPRLFNKFIKTLVWEDFALYPDTNLLKDALAKHHNTTSLNIYLGSGSAECISDVFKCFVEKETITTTEPCFPMYDVYAAQNYLTVNKIQPTKQLKYVTNKILGTDLIVISRPSNPVGYFFTRQDIVALLELNPYSWVLVDEAYIDYVENADEIVDLVNLYDNLIISRSFSKVFGAAGCRVGYLISNITTIDTISKLRPMYEITGPSQRYALFLLNNQIEVQKYCKKTISERKKLCRLFKSTKLDVVSSEGNWIHVQQIDVLLDILKANDIHVKTNISLPHKQGMWLRITVGPGVTKLFKEILH